jgi:hypothetical protein
MAGRFGRFDPDMQMFVNAEPAVLNLNRLGFLRWCEENDRGEHGTAGPPSGPLVETSVAPATHPAPDYSGKAA